MSDQLNEVFLGSKRLADGAAELKNDGIQIVQCFGEKDTF